MISAGRLPAPRAGLHPSTPAARDQDDPARAIGKLEIKRSTARRHPLDIFLQVAVAVLLLNLLLCLVRVVRGPKPADRVTGVVLAGTTGAAMLAVISVTSAVPGFRDDALVIVALALVVTMSVVAARPGTAR